MAFPLETFSVSGFTGLNDSGNVFALEPNEARDAQNVRTEDGSITKINGAVVFSSDIAGATTTWGLFDYVQRGGTRRFLRVVTDAAGTALWYDNAGTWTIISAVADYHASLHTFAIWPRTDTVFIANESGNVEPKWNGTLLTAWGLAAPPAAATFNATIDGSMVAGDYLYRFTYYNSTTTEESNPSPVSLAMTAAAHPNDGIRLDIPADGTFDVNAADQVRVWRTAVGTTTPYYLDGTAAYAGAAITFDSTQSDVNLTAGGTLMETDNDRPLAMRYILLHKDRIFGAGNGTNPQRLFYSKLNEPENWPVLNYIDTYPPKPGGLTEITGLLPYRDQLYVLTRDQMWVLLGTSASDFLLERLPQGVGCVSHHTISSFGNLMMWWSEAGPVQWDGTQFSFPGGEKLRELIRWTGANATDWTNAGSPLGIEPSRLDRLFSAFVKFGGRLQWWTVFTRRGQTQNDRILVYDMQTGSWQIRNYGVNANVLAVIEDANDMDRLFVGTTSQDVLEMDRGFTIDGAAVNGYWTTPWYDMGQPSHQKKLRGIHVWLKGRDPSLASHTLTVRWYLDYSATESGNSTVVVPASRTTPAFIPLAGKFVAASFRFENAAASQDFSIDRYDIEFRRMTMLREVAA